MKNKLIIALLACAAMPFATSCDDDDDNDERTVTFETVALGPDGYVSAQDITIDNTLTFKTDTSWGAQYPMGFYVSSCTDQKTEGSTNMYSVYNTSGHNASKQFAIFNTMSSLSDGYAIQVVGQDNDIEPKYAFFNLTTYTYLSTKNGDYFAKKFEDGDYFGVTLDGYKKGVKTASIVFYPIDKRDGKNVEMTDWTFVDLTPLGEVDAIKIDMISSDTSNGYINTPAYIAMDDFTYED